MTIHKDLPLFLLLMLAGLALSILDLDILHWATLLLEGIHVAVVITLLVIVWRFRQKYSEMSQFGWNIILFGLLLLLVGSIVDMMDDPPSIAWLNHMHIPFSRGWEQAFLKKILGYTAGFTVVAYGFFQWIPWILQSQEELRRANHKLSAANRQMRRKLMTYAGPYGDLSNREKQVLVALANGHSNQQLADLLLLKPKTVHAHLYNIYCKIGVKSRAEAITWAIKSGFLDREKTPVTSGS
jgi:DNA-binding CsgD family transcriptional regulator